MFETAELGQSVDKKEYKKRVRTLRQELLQAQRGLRAAGIPCILVFKGVNAAGKGETINRLAEWMDPRWIGTNAYRPPTTEERERPRMWRYWRDLPPRGRIGIFMSAWYNRPLLALAEGEAGTGQGADRNSESGTVSDTVSDTVSGVESDIEDALTFERALADDGAIILKFWLHLGRKQQKEALERLEADPDEAWRVTRADWDDYRRYDAFVRAAERIITRTSTAHAPWHIVEGTDSRYRELRIGEIIRDAIAERLAALRAAGVELDEPGPRDRIVNRTGSRARGVAAATVAPESAEPPEPNGEASLARTRRTLFDTLSMPEVDRDEYKQAVKTLQGRLARLHRRAREQGRPAVLVFEGPDAAGKGGAIRRITGATDARWTRVVPIAAPTDEELARHYLWRFWRHLPRAGELTIFDRSWYGRVLVERVEAFAHPDEWRRAYAEINEFERELDEHGAVLVKFWVHITSDEQERRFVARQQTPHKAWKLTDEDWRNRAKWDLYERAAHEMIERTSTHAAPWVLVGGNDKLHARLKVLDHVCNALETALD